MSATLRKTAEKTWSYIIKASPTEMAEMLEWIEEENKFQQQEPHGEWIDGSDQQLPIVYKLERHGVGSKRNYQMQAYTPSGVMMDNSYHESFVRCNNCGHVTIWDEADEGIYCSECGEYLEPYFG